MAARGGLDSVLRYAVSGVAGGIGLASESMHARKEKKNAKLKAKSSSGSSPSTLPPQEEASGEEENIIEQEDEKQWALDDAQSGLLGGVSSDEEPPAHSPSESSAPKKAKTDEVNVTEGFLKRYPPPAPNDDAQPLPLPVILPQRRPKDRTRGFIRAYAPALATKGVDQAMFLDFLQTFEKASEASPWINAINLAGVATTFIPDGFAVGLAVGLAIQMSVRVAMDLQSRSRTNSFIDKINDEFYRPRGLYCLIMTWSPESSGTSNTFDLTSTITAKAKSNPSGPLHIAKKFSNSSGKTYADMEFPEVAPLVYPALDNLAEQQGEEAASKRAKLKQKGTFVGDYWDKRAQAKYVSAPVHDRRLAADYCHPFKIGKHPDSVLAQTPKPTFTSRYADPNHPASSGSLISLVTGGHINPPPVQQARGLGGGFGGLLGGGYESGQADGRRGGHERGLGALLNRGGSGGYDRSGQGQTYSDVDTQRGSSGDVRTGGGLGLGSGLLGLPTPQTAMKKLLKKVSWPSRFHYGRKKKKQC